MCDDREFSQHQKEGSFIPMETNNDFSRSLSLLRRERGVSQRSAAKELGISQALLSHYENGAREPGLAFVRRACDYYNVSADFLLGRSMSRDGTNIIEAEELYDASAEKGNVLRGSVAAMLNKKLLVNSMDLLFDLLGKVGSREAVSQAGAYMGGALYQLFRLLYRAAGGNEGYFSTDAASFDMGAMSADMTLARIQYGKALTAYRGEFPAMDAQSLAEDYQGFSQSMAQVFHASDERVRKLQESVLPEQGGRETR